MIKVIKDARELFLKSTPFVMCTIIFKHGSAPREVGATMLVTEEGIFSGSIGGGQQEFEVRNYAMELLNLKKSENIKYEVSKEYAAKVGMVCGGQNIIHYQYIDINNMKILDYFNKIIECVGDDNCYIVYNIKNDMGMSIEINNEIFPFSNGNEVYDTEDLFKMKIKNPMKVYVFGGGHIAKAVCSILKFINLEVTVIDDRKDFITEEDFPGINRIVIDFSKLDDLEINNSDYVCIMTRGHKYDLIVLESVLKKNPYYIGVVGNKKKSKLYREEFANTNLEETYNLKVHLPVGLDILALTPEEIAISIAGEVIKSYRSNK